MNNQYKNIKIALIISIAISLSFFGIMAIGLYAKAENKIDNLEKQIENQNMLIEIIKKSCEVE